VWVAAAGAQEMKRLAWPVFSSGMALSVMALFAIVAPNFNSLTVYAKPKIAVKIKVHEGMGRDRAQDSLSKSGSSSGENTAFATVFFMNVTATSDNAEAVAKNNGEWCISGNNELDINGEYAGTLDGNNLDVDFPLKNGKTKKYHYEIFDHKWRKLADL
jgi:hypothetical protein